MVVVELDKIVVQDHKLCQGVLEVVERMDQMVDRLDMVELVIHHLIVRPKETMEEVHIVQRIQLVGEEEAELLLLEQVLEDRVLLEDTEFLQI